MQKILISLILALFLPALTFTFTASADNQVKCLTDLASLTVNVRQPVVTVIAGTNRKGSNSLKVANIVSALLENEGASVNLVNLQDLPPELLSTPYNAPQKPEAFEKMKEMVMGADGVVVVVPEYNGGMPGVLKLFFDHMPFPQGVRHKLFTFVGVSAGQAGGVVPAYQIEQILNYQTADIMGDHTYIPEINSKLNADGTQITDAKIAGFLKNQMNRFVDMILRRTLTFNTPQKSP